MAIRWFQPAVLAIALLPGPSACQSCSEWESKKSIDGSTMTFRLDPFPWIVTADLDGNVTIQNAEKKSVCKTKFDSVVSVYFGSGRLVYFRSADIASDELFTLDGLSCKEARKMKDLGQKSEAKTTCLLRSLGICKHQ